MNKVKILVVDDDADLCNLISDILIHGKYSTDRAYNYNQALKLLQKNYYNLIITDNRLGVFSGLELVKFAKEKNPDSKTFIITAYGNDELKEKADNLNVEFVIDKPFEVNDLVKKVKSCLNNKAC
jgi:DNA-binding NtrC family response regulator